MLGKFSHPPLIPGYSGTFNLFIVDILDFMPVSFRNLPVSLWLNFSDVFVLSRSFVPHIVWLEAKHLYK